MIEISSLVVGMIVGAILKLLHLPVPAPNNVAGILGIVGLFLGYMIIKK